MKKAWSFFLILMSLAFSPLVHAKAPLRPPVHYSVDRPIIDTATPYGADGFGLRIVSFDTSPHVTVEISTPDHSRVLNTYMSSQRVYDVGVITLALSSYEEKAYFRSTGVIVTLVDTNGRSDEVLVKTESLFPIGDPPQNPNPPFIESAAAGCADGYCIGILGNGFTKNSLIEIRSADGSRLLNVYSGRYNPLSPSSMSLSLLTFEERVLFRDQGLLVTVKGESEATSNSVLVHTETHALPGPPSEIVPKVYFPYWTDSSVLPFNNCYNYATNRRTDNYAQPGEASGQMYNSLSCEDVQIAASSDLGLEKVNFSPFLSKSGDTLIALVVAPGFDFHWYRRGDDGYWTHKPGGTVPLNVDNRGELITSPETADRGWYTNFCGYFRLKNYGIEAHEQNGGMVRIGDMTELPTLPVDSAKPKKTALSQDSEGFVESEVELLIFSGRPNPILKLRDLLPYLDIVELKKRARGLQAKIKAAGESVPAAAKLGYNGIQIIDHEGLIFPAGTEVHIHGGSLGIQVNGKSTRVPVLGLEQTERNIISRFQSSFPKLRGADFN